MNKPAIEAYYEPEAKTFIQPYCPFRCHIQSWNGDPLLCGAHWHYAIEILYATQGQASILLNGRLYAFAHGDMVLINARDVHAIWGEPQTQYICIKFDPEILYTAARFAFESRYVLPFTMADSSPQRIFPASEINDTPLPLLIQEIMREMIDRKYCFELAVRTNISRIFLWVLRSWQGKGLKVESVHDFREQDMERLQAVFDCLDHHYMNHLTVAEMAALCNMSYSYFSRYFKSVMGKSFTAYLNYVRITEAEKLLLSTDKSITEIAMEAGFSSASYFISQFRRMKKQSPRQYRQQLLRPKP